MKKIFLFLIFSIYQINFLFASNLDVNANIKSGDYDFVLEVFLNTNDKNAKVFYYTDGEGRMDNVKEFKKEKPIIISANTTLNYYAVTTGYNSTIIKENIYTFSYPKKINLNYENGKIIIKNNSGNVINIGYYKIEANSLNYTINKNTFIKENSSYEIEYKAKNNEVINLYYPNGELNKTTTYKEEIKPIPQEVDSQIPDGEINTKNEGFSGTDKDIQVENIENTINKNNTGNISTENIENSQVIIENKDDFNLTQEIKTSSIESNKNKNIIFYLIFIIIIFMIAPYNIYMTLKKNKEYKLQATTGKIKEKKKKKKTRY